MQLSKLLNPGKLWEQVQAGMIRQVVHPDGVTRLYNYTPECQFSNAWTPEAMLSRGLIVRNDTVIARPFRKFFNLNTEQFPETQVANLPATPPEITTKLDGSLGIGYRSPLGTMVVATRGSFTSEQAIWGNKYLKQHSPSAVWPEGWTPLWEIIYNENRIVVEYDFEGLVLIGCVNINTGEEMKWGQLVDLADSTNFRVVQHINKPLEYALKDDVDGEEGYVLTWHLGQQPPLKVKFKFSDYVRLHKVLTGVTPKGIWECLSQGVDLSPMLDEKLPRHFTDFVRLWKGRLSDKKAALADRVHDIMMRCPLEQSNPKDREQRKYIAMYFINETKDMPELAAGCFAALDGKNVDEALWKLVKPRGNEDAPTIG